MIGLEHLEHLLTSLEPYCTSPEIHSICSTRSYYMQTQCHPIQQHVYHRKPCSVFTQDFQSTKHSSNINENLEPSLNTISHSMTIRKKCY